MASRTYTVGMSNLTVIANATLVFINPSANVGVRLLRAWCSQLGSPTSQNLGVKIFTQITAFPTVVGATPATHHLGPGTAPISAIVSGTAGAAGTCGVNASANGAGTQTIVIPDSFNVLNGWLYIPTPVDEPIEAAAGVASGIGMAIIGTPATLTGWSAGITFAELA